MMRVLIQYYTKKKDKLIALIFISFSIVSCAVEDVKVTSVSRDLSNISMIRNGGSLRKEMINVDVDQYTLELANICSSIPVYEDSQVNQDLAELKIIVSEYVSGVKELNQDLKNEAFSDFEHLYKKIQLDKEKLNSEEQENLSRILVRIKTNVNMLESANISDN